MTRLLGGRIKVHDIIFAHIRGQPKVAEILRTDEPLGVTITDNGAGMTFIKAIRSGGP